MRRALPITALLILGAAPALAEEPINAIFLPPAPLHEQVLHVPGDPARPVSLVVTVYTPEGPGPFPLAVMNHGANDSKESPAAMPRNRASLEADYFLSRGYAVALPMMRGYAGSGGAQTAHGCELSEVALNNGRDIEGLIGSLAADPQIDTSRVVVAGQSFGGWNALGLGALQPDRVRGVINFNGGMRTSGCIDARINFNALIAAAQRLGANTQIPSIWFYGENDTLFPEDVWRGMHQVYTEAGASAELVDIGAFLDDSHVALGNPRGILLAAPKLDAFLARIGMPHTVVQPHYMPIPYPAPSHYAAIDALPAVPWVDDRGRATYQQFLDSKPPRVFVVAPGGTSATAQGGFDPLARALALCATAHATCVPYAIDNDVVWVPPPAPVVPRATHFAPIGAVDAVPWVNAQSRAAYARFLTQPLPRAFVVARGGQAVGTQGGHDPLGRGLAKCAAAGIACVPYAVDNDVVFVKPRD